MNKNESNEKAKLTWTCLICQEPNPSNENICQACGAYREEPAYDAIADDED